MVEIPANGAAQTAFEALGGRPAEFAGNLRSIDGIAPIVSGAIVDEGDELSAGAEGWIGTHLVEEIADGGHDVEVPALAVAADIVGFAHTAALQNGANGGAVVEDIEPVTDLGAVSVDRQGLAFEGAENHQRDELFWKLQRTVVVGAICDEDGQAEGVTPGAHEWSDAALVAAYGLCGAYGVVSEKAGSPGLREP